MRDTRESRIDRTIEQDSFTLSIRKDSHKRELKRLFKKAGEKNFTEDIFEAIKFWNRNQGRQDQVYREDKNKKKDWRDHLQEDNKMTKGELRNFIMEHFDVSAEKVEDKSKGYLQGLLSIKLSGLGVDIAMNEIKDVDANYLVGAIEGARGRVDTAKLVNDALKAESEELQALKDARLKVGEEQVLRDDLQKRVDDGDLSEVEALRLQRATLGEDNVEKSVEELKADRLEGN